MGMYTELHFNKRLNKDTPAEVIAMLQYMVGDSKEHPEIDHDLFKADRWTFMFQSDSYYFDADTSSTIRKDDISDDWALCIRSNLKNYGDEIGLFLNWISPYVWRGYPEFLGFYRYEEDEIPTLLWTGRDGIMAFTPGVPQLEEAQP